MHVWSWLQERLTRSLAAALETRHELHDLVILAMGAVGRGGEGNQGQRIRDEILAVQSRNHAKVIWPSKPFRISQADMHW